MPIIPVKFKSDKEIEEEVSTNPFEAKVRKHNTLDFENQVVCYYCSNVIMPKCKLGITEYPCAPDCLIVVKEKKIQESCEHYEELSCKKGYYASGIPMSCPDYNGPKPHVEYHGRFVLISYGGIDKVKSNMKIDKK